jgi:hypothetical protein
MARLKGVIVAAALACAVAGCGGRASEDGPSAMVRSSVASTARVPAHLARLAVLYPRTSDRDMAAAYQRLAGATFQLKAQRRSLQIVERADLQAILDEQGLQAGGTVSDQTAVHVGRMLGVDGVVLYRIDGPNLRDRVFAKYSGDLPPFLLTSKVILVESAEVVYHNVVVTPVAGLDAGHGSAFAESRIQPLVRAALDRGIDRTAVDLARAFQSSW